MDAVTVGTEPAAASASDRYETPAESCDDVPRIGTLADFKSVLTESLSTNNARVMSVTETIFRQWASWNNIQTEIVNQFVQAGLHHHFLINQGLVTPFELLFEQAKALLTEHFGSF